MAYNISETTTAVGSGTAGLDIWTFTIDVSVPGTYIVNGDFNDAGGEAPDGYVFSPPDTTAFGDLTATSGSLGTFTFEIDRAAAIASAENQTVVFTITGTDGGLSDTDTVRIEILVCVCRGTEIETPDGPQKVETLRPGDHVTLADGRVEEVLWIGSRKVSLAEQIADPALRPVRIETGGFGPDMPSAPLWVSQQHRIEVTDWRAELLFGEDQVLAPAKGLVDGESVQIADPSRDVEYFHVLFAQHEVMVTNGLPTESFCPGKYTLSSMESAVRGELLSLFPQLDTEFGMPTVTTALRPWETEVLAS